MRLAVREAVLSIRRAPTLSFLSVLTIAFALFVVGLFGLVAVNMGAAISQVQERVEIVMYLDRGTPERMVLAAMDDILTFPEVETATYVDEATALDRARTELVEFQGLLSDLVTNPLPASIEIKLRPGFRDEQTVSRIAERVGGFRFAEDVRFGRDWIARLDQLRSIAAIIGLVIGGAFAMASIMIIGTTIRMTVFQRASEIGIMRLVGATDSFIRAPFLLEGTFKGALGGMTAVALNYGVFVAVDETLLESQFFEPAQWLAIIGFGTFLGFLASATSVRRHLRKV